MISHRCLRLDRMGTLVKNGQRSCGQPDRTPNSFRCISCAGSHACCLKIFAFCLTIREELIPLRYPRYSNKPLFWPGSEDCPATPENIYLV